MSAANNSSSMDADATPPNPEFAWYTSLGGKYVKTNLLEPSTATPRHPTAAPRPRLPPLPTSDYKVVFRPRGLNLSHISTVQFAQAVKYTTQAPEDAARKWKVRIDPVQNIALISTPQQLAAQNLSKMNNLHINGTTVEIRAYEAAPADSVRGVIHSIPDDATTESLLQAIVAEGHQLLQARRMGKSASAVLTFAGSKLPRYVYLEGGELRCYPFCRSALVCHKCRSTGHRADVCTANTSLICNTCGVHHAPTDDCTPKCALCDGDHPTGGKGCTRKHRPPLRRNPPTNSTSSERPSRSRSRGPPPNFTPPRGRSNSGTRSSTSGPTSTDRSSRSSSRGGRSSSRSRDPSTPRPQVSWAEATSRDSTPQTILKVTPPILKSHPPHPQPATSLERELAEQNRLLSEQNRRLSAELTEVRKILQTQSQQIALLTSQQSNPKPPNQTEDHTPLKRKTRKLRHSPETEEVAMETLVAAPLPPDNTTAHFNHAPAAPEGTRFATITEVEQMISGLAQQISQLAQHMDKRMDLLQPQINTPQTPTGPSPHHE